MNPVRDFGPKLFTVLVGWGLAAFPGIKGCFWMPIIAPIIRAIIGGLHNCFNGKYFP